MNMDHFREQLRREANLMERFSSAYRRKMGRMIRQLNAPSSTGGVGVADAQCLRLCVETLDMILASQNQFARVLDQMSAEDDSRPTRIVRKAA
jgi:hypothetical protein